MPDSDTVGTTLVLGLIKRAHVRSSALKPGTVEVDPSKLRPLARMGGNTYTRVVEGFDLPRVSWKEVEDKDQYRHKK